MTLPEELPVCFGSMRLYRGARLLLDGGKPVRIGGRAFDLLVALLDRAGQVVSRDELVAHVWPNTFVEETSLRVHIGALRKLLGDGQGGLRFIVTVPGRGYSFVAPLGNMPDAKLPEAVGVGPVRGGIPARLTRMLGRDEDLTALRAMLAQGRLVSIVGEGGIGKTTLAVAACEAGVAAFRDGIVFLDLAMLREGGLVPGALGAALGVAVPAGDPVGALCAHLAPRQVLLVFDNCEHLVDAAAACAGQLLRAAPGVSILATSREPLRCEGEQVRRLSPLQSPSRADTLSAAQALAYSAIQLFVERAGASLDGYTLTDKDSGTVAEICRQLGGIPLAIELAAGRLGFFGLPELLARLDDRFRILSGGHRTVSPRHQNLRALHDWSYRLLSGDEQRVFRRLSVFPCGFLLEDAVAIAAQPDDRAPAVEELVAGLVAKSLVAADLGGETMRYRLLDTTRAYAGERLAEAGDEAAVRRRHAEHTLQALRIANPQWKHEGRMRWLERHACLMDDVREALDWACGADGDAVLGATVAREAFQLALQMSLFTEFCERVEKAIECLQSGAAQEMALEAELGLRLSTLWAQSQLPGDKLRRLQRPLERAAQAARQLRDDSVHAQIPYARWGAAFGHGDYPASLAAAKDMESISLSSGDADGIIISRRMQAQSWHFLGDHRTARRYANLVLEGPLTPVRIAGKVLDPLDRRISMRIVLARIHWLEGRPAQAAATVREAISFAANEMSYAQCQVLGMAACPIAIWSGDEEQAARWTEELGGLATRHALDYWTAWADSFRRVLDSLPFEPMGQGSKLHDLLGTMQPGAVTATLLERSREGIVGWCSAEHLRARGTRVLTHGDTAQAGTLFREAHSLALRQGAVAWQLRAALDICRLQRSMGEEGDGENLLHAACAVYADGDDFPDLRKGRAWLRETARP